jgi:capsular exopolysaccharide synthesis family protein
MTGQIQPRSAAPLARPIMPMAAAQPTMTPREIWGIIRQRWKWIVSFAALGLLVGGIWYGIQNLKYPRFTTIAAIEVFPQEEKDPTKLGDQTLNKDTQFQFRNTLASKLKSRTYWLNDFLKSPVIIGDPTVNKQPLAWFKDLKEGRWWNRRDDMIVRADRYFKQYLNVAVDREANIIQMTLRCYGSAQKDDGQKMLALLGEIYKSRLKTEVDTKWVGYKSNLEAKRTDIQKALDNGPLQKLKDLRTSYSFGNLSGINFRDYMEEKMADLESQSSALESEKARLASEVNFLKSRAESDYDAVVREQIEQDPVASQMRQRLTELEVLLSGQMASFGENHRRVKETRDSRDQARKDLQDRQKQIGDIVRQSQYILNRESLDSKTAELKAREIQLETARKQHSELRNARAEYETAETKRDELQKQFESFDTLIKKVEALMTSPDTTKIELLPVVSPLEKDGPRWYIHIPVGFIFGLMIGLGIAFLLEVSNKLLRTPRDVMRHVSAPLLGMICHEQDDAETEGVDLLQVVRQAPYSFMSDNYRQFRTNLRLSESAANKKILLVTSPTAGDGKTTVVMNLSSTFVAEGKKVLVIDTNFRRPSMAANLPRPAQGQSAAHADFGLSNYLLGQCSDPRDIIRRSGIEGLDVIDSGPIPPNPAEVLGSIGMKKLLDTVRESYDYVLLDGPALLVSDAKALAALVEGTLVVFNAKRTHRGEAQRTLRELREIQATVVGTVLLGVENLKGGYFGQLYKAFQDYNKKENPIVKPVN